MDSKFDLIDDDFSTLSKGLANAKDEQSFAGAFDEILAHLAEQNHAPSTENAVSISAKPR